jgi:phosphatidylglycerol lysyltransferase
MRRGSRPANASVTERDVAREIVMRHGWNAIAYQILNPGMQLWFTRERDAVAGYARFGRSRIVAGAPVCGAERLEEAVIELEDEASAHGDRVIYFGAGERLERLIERLGGRAVVSIGAQPTWNPAGWVEIVRRKRSLRAQLHRASNKGVCVEEWTSFSRAGLAPLRSVLGAWLASRGLPPLGFLVTPDLLDDLGDRRVFVAVQGGARTVVAFLVATPVPAREGWLIEQWPRMPTAPNGTTHLLVDAAMRAFHDAGASYVSLGLAPLSERVQTVGDVRRRHAIWPGLLFRWLRAHGRRFYNFRGLEAFKAGMEPHAWEPVYAVMPGPRVRLRDLRAIAGAFAGGPPERLVARAVVSAVATEWRQRVLRR